MAGKGSDFEVNGVVNISAAGANAALREISEGLGDIARKQEALNKNLGGEKKTTLNYKIVVDDSGVKQLVFFEKTRLTVLDKANAELERARKLQDGSVTSLRQQVNQAKQARDEMARYASSAGGLGTKLGTVNAAWVTQNQRVKDLQRQLDIANASNIWQKLTAQYNLGGFASAGRQITELVNVFQSVSIIVGQVIGSVNQLFDALQKLQSIKLTFQGIGAGGDVGAVFSESSRIALGLGVNLNTVRDAFQQLSPVILATGGNIGDVSAVTEALSSRFVTFGLSADKSRRVMNGVVQAFSKGKLMAEELTQQISEADPAFRTDLAQAVGVSVKELGEMVKAGRITNQVLLEAIPRMSKAAGLFGKLGTSALDAAKGFRTGSVTVEQFRAQLSNIEQLALEDLVNPDTGALQPLLASLAELRAVITEVVVSFAGSEVFETFLDVLGQLASQVSLIIQVLVQVGSAIASITQPVFGAINAIDSLGGTLEGVGIISAVVAGIITTKLIVSLATLAGGAAIGGAIGGINLLAKAIGFLNFQAIVGLIKTIGANIVAFIGLGGATSKAAAAEGLATLATQARTVASKILTKQLGLQAAAEGLLGGGGGGKVPGKGVTGGRGVTVNPVTSGGRVFGPAPPPPNAQKAAAEAAKAATQTSRWGAATKNLATNIKAVPKNPYLIIGAIIGTTILATVGYTKSIEGAGGGTKDFNTEVKRLKDSALKTKEGIAQAANESLTFDERLKKIQASANNIDLKNLDVGTAGRALEDKNLTYQKLIEDAKNYNFTVTKGAQESQKAVAEYNKENDKSGTKGKNIAQDIAVAEGTVNKALEITKKKRAEMIAEAEKSGKSQSKITVNQITAYDKEIKKLEEKRKGILKTKEEAQRKGIEIPVNVKIDEAINIVTTLGEEAKALKAQVIVETDPQKRKKLQGELNALENQLKFLQSDPVEVAIEAKLKIDQRAFQDSANLARATLEKFQAAAELAQATFNLQAGYVSGQERTVNKELDTLNKRFDKEKEIRDERIQAAQDAGAGEEYINRLKAEDRKADKAARAEVEKKEKELEKLAENKRQIEIQALNAKLKALPKQQQAEQKALKAQQELTRLELERLKAASTRAKVEGLQRVNKLKEELKQAEGRGDTQAVEELTRLFNDQLAIQKLLVAEEGSLGKSLANLKEVNRLGQESLDLKQQAQTLDLQAELAQQNALAGQKAQASASQTTASATSQQVSNAKQIQQLAQAAAEYTRSGAAAARQEADARGEAREQLEGQVDAATGAAETSVGKTEDSAAGAATNAGEFSSNLEGAAGWASSVATTLANLDGSEVNFSVAFTGAQGLWTGGPTVGGQTYRINELGKEGFLSSTGTLSPINKPRNALWKAPGKGMVIPAHIMSSLDIPTGRVSTGVRPAAMAGSSNGMSRIVRAIQNALTQTPKSDPGMHEMASVQAHQAQQIGKLSRAVTKLADKDWNINVGVRNTGSTAYLDALNRRM